VAALEELTPEELDLLPESPLVRRAHLLASWPVMERLPSPIYASEALCASVNWGDGLAEELRAIRVPHTDEELQRAENRKARGIPPGKKDDPMGDELNWEQLLSFIKAK